MPYPSEVLAGSLGKDLRAACPTNFKIGTPNILERGRAWRRILDVDVCRAHALRIALQSAVIRHGKLDGVAGTAVREDLKGGAIWALARCFTRWCFVVIFTGELLLDSLMPQPLQLGTPFNFLLAGAHSGSRLTL